VIKCSNCGHANSGDAVFCAKCNFYLDWAEDSEPEEPVTEPDTASQPGEASRPAAAPEPDAVADVRSRVTLAQGLIADHGRGDLAESLRRAREDLDSHAATVTVVGEFKRGKSTLINALLETAVCPTDPDIVTTVPTIVRYGEQKQAVAASEPEQAMAPPTEEPIALDRLEDFVSELGNPHNRKRLRSVEVQLPHVLLSTGLRLVDTPGVGGLESAEGCVTLGSLANAHGMLFVTDASQELTGPELAFLREAQQRCPRAALVVTKTDLYPEWRRIVELDISHLANAAIDIPVFAVSNFLRLRATAGPTVDAAMVAESGFLPLTEHLLSACVEPERQSVAEVAAREIEFVVGQVEQAVAAERVVLERPQEAEAVVEQLRAAQIRTQRLTVSTASWQQMLNDGIADLVAEIEFDLQARMRTVLRDAEAVIDAGDPKEAWADFESWLRRQAVSAASANYDRLTTLANSVATAVATAFDLAADPSAGGADLVPRARPLTAPDLASIASLENPSGRLGSLLLAGRTATIVPMMLLGTLGHLLLPVVAPVAAVLAAGIGQKVIRDERKRQIAFRRQQAKIAARKYVDEVAFLVGKDSRDALRETQRQLRDEFQFRATALHRSSVSNLGAVQRAIELPPEQRAERVEQLARTAREIEHVAPRKPSAATLRPRYG